MIRSYWRLAPVALLLAGLLMLMSGCQNQQNGAARQSNQNGPAGGALTGQVMLSPPDPQTSNTGILVYLAGTSFQARTDASGSYKIENLPSGAYEIHAEKTGYQSVLVDSLVIDPAKHTHENPALAKIAILEATSQSNSSTSSTTGFGSLSGVVFLQGQEKSSGVRVRVEGTQFVTVSNDDGSYQLLNIPPGTYSVSFAADNYVPYTATGVTVVSGSTTTVGDAALERRAQPILIGATPGTSVAPAAVATPAGTPIVASQMTGDRSISGMVQLFDTAGQPIADFSRAVVAINDSDIVATLDEEGRFRITNLAPAMYTLIGSLDKGEPTKLPVDLTTQQAATVILKISAAGAEKGKGSIVGRVVVPGPDDQPLPDASGVRVGVAGTQATAITAKDGTFKLDEVPEGNYSLSLTKQGFDDLTQDGVQVAAGQPTDVGELRLEVHRDYPRVVSTTPPSGTRNVPVGLDIVLQVKFSKKMDPAAVRQAVNLQPPTAAQIFFGRGSHPLADDDALVVVLSSLDQRAPLRFQTNYQLGIAKTASDIDGTPMKDDFAMNFTTGAPGIISTYPANGDRNAYADQNNSPVMINFNTRIDPDSLNERYIRVRPDNGVSVRINHSEDGRNGWTALTIGTTWQPDTEYTITIGREVRAFNGQPLGNTPYSLRFRTAKMEVIQAPLQIVR